MLPKFEFSGHEFSVQISLVGARSGIVRSCLLNKGKAVLLHIWCGVELSSPLQCSFDGHCKHAPAVFIKAPLKIVTTSTDVCICQHNKFICVLIGKFARWHLH